MTHIAFIAGATGYTGRAVVETCAKRGIKAHAHVRPDSPVLAKWRQHFEALGACVDTTPWAAAAMTQRLATIQPTLVFALLGTTRQRARRENLSAPYQSIDYGLTMMLIDAARAVVPAPRLIYLSAMGVRQSRNAYIQTRFQVEQHLQKTQMPHIVARPGIISGDREESRPIERAACASAHAVCRILDAFGAHGVADKVRPLTGAQLSQALVTLALDPAPEPLVAAETLVALRRDVDPTNFSL